MSLQGFLASRYNQNKAMFYQEFDQTYITLYNRVSQPVDLDLVPDDIPQCPVLYFNGFRRSDTAIKMILHGSGKLSHVRSDVHYSDGLQYGLKVYFEESVLATDRPVWVDDHIDIPVGIDIIAPNRTPDGTEVIESSGSQTHLEGYIRLHSLPHVIMSSFYDCTSYHDNPMMLPRQLHKYIQCRNARRRDRIVTTGLVLTIYIIVFLLILKAWL